MLRNKQFLGYVLYVLRRHRINLSKQLPKVFFLSIVQKALAKVEGKILAVVTGYGNLSLYLLLRR